MKTTSKILAALALLGAASAAQASPNCTIKLKANDAMQFDLKTATVSASCPKINIELVHTGKLPAQAMGHNVVISQTADMNAITAAAIKAGAAAGYVPKGGAKVIAATPLVGGGASTKASFAGSKLKAGGDYSFFCSFPGHSALMKGKLVVTK
ncbi:azurin [Pseudoxanthomonas helianthi]|uniref:Azurin n=1 Tax=Pseudoxanthomonas helianthi TaxID=1453541 RepID=A0A941ASI5_9GAMM|nr:azurin [Pseudoxanthomonas helianthi]MBP3983475.1 azurin [Pseudoxanthomonas helianthi]